MLSGFFSFSLVLLFVSHFSPLYCYLSFSFVCTAISLVYFFPLCTAISLSFLLSPCIAACKDLLFTDIGFAPLGPSEVPKPPLGGRILPQPGYVDTECVTHRGLAAINRNRSSMTQLQYLSLNANQLNGTSKRRQNDLARFARPLRLGPFSAFFLYKK